MNRYALPTDLDESAVAAMMDPGCSMVMGAREKLIVTYLDTFDWRLFRGGFVLVEERGRDRRLVLIEGGCEPYVVNTAETPKLAEDVPPGHLAKSAGPLMDIRALVPVGQVSVDRREGRIDDADGNMVARLRLEVIDVSGGVNDPDAIAANTLGTSDPRRLRKILEVQGVRPLPSHDLVEAAAARGRTPGDYSSKLDTRLNADQPAERSMRTILLDLLDTLEANVQGTIDDVDSEFLHDLRVACRRTRSALTQLKGLLDPKTIAPFNTDFKWLGSATGPLRDLDVYLLEMPTYRAMLPEHAVADLDPLEELMKEERARAHRSVVRALRSARFRRLVTSWRRTLATVDPAPTEVAAATTAELAARRITKAYRRILKHGAGLGEDSPASGFHRLRIDAKKLRYLLEFFRSLYPRRKITARIKELKRLQDILGGFNDMVVQRKRLSVYAGDLRADPRVDAGAILTLGRLAGTLEQRQENYRSMFHDAFVEFSSKPVRTAYGRLFGGKESK